VSVVLQSRLLLVSLIILVVSGVIGQYLTPRSQARDDKSPMNLTTTGTATSGTARASEGRRAVPHQAGYELLRALGLDALRRGSPHEAIEYFEQALQQQIADAGENNERALQVLADIANAHLWLDDEMAAYAAATRAATIAERLGTSLSTQKIWSVSVLAETLIALGEYSRAESLLVDLVDASREQLGTNDPSLFNPLYTLALLRFAQGRRPQAEQLAKAACEIATQLVGEKSSHAANARNILAAVLLEGEQFANAEREARVVIDIADRHSSTQPHPLEMTAKHILAEALIGQAAYGRAQILLQEELNVLEAVRASDWRVARAASALGEVYMRTNRFEDAERTLLLAKKKLTKTKGWPIEREVRNLARRLEEFDALRPNKVSALTD
jgi:tetratricopeptide (TPR) repeat protein